jgi:hypothetical protein
MWEVATVDQRSGFRLAVLNAFLNGAIVFLAFSYVGYLRRAEFSSRTSTTILYGILLVLTVAGPTFSLTAIEQRGIRFFGNRRGFRISKGVGWTIVGHASYGWLVSGALCGVLSFTPIRENLPWQDAYVPFLVWHIDGAQLTIAAVALAGMLVFEVWVFLGVRGMKYANPTQSGEVQ